MQIGEQCDDGNMASGDGCTANCKVENGYVCKTTRCTQLLSKVSENVNSAGVILGFRYNFPDIANSGNLQNITVTNGPAPSNYRIVRPLNDATTVKILLDYCGLLPPQNITVELNSNSPLGNVKYISLYNLGAKTAIPFSISALKEPDDYLH